MRNDLALGARMAEMPDCRSDRARRSCASLANCPVGAAESWRRRTHWSDLMKRYRELVAGQSIQGRVAKTAFGRGSARNSADMDAEAYFHAMRYEPAGPTEWPVRPRD